ncbi:MAG: CapA family protein, partial [Lachnospiraceae bacterium]|nr:CapA family protein [Lachnospiraceae bacterium]
MRKAAKKPAIALLLALILAFTFAGGAGADAKTKINEVRSGVTDNPDSACILMVGDVLLHPPVTESGKRNDGTLNYDHLFKNIKKDIEAADIAIANQEVILGGSKLGLSGYPCFNGPFEVGDSLVNAGFNVVLHATNHALDKGNNGVANCIDFWEENYPGMGVLGIYDNKKDFNSVYVKVVKGIKVAILNYTYGTNGIKMPADNPYAVKLLTEKQVRKDVEKAKKKADFIVVCPHWGTEYTHKTTAEQEKWTKLFAQVGVDLVIGAHPHVIEPVKEVTRPDGKNMLVYYSLGNFVNSTGEYKKGVADRMLGEMAKVYI